jgi:hypothetical protein
MSSHATASGGIDVVTSRPCAIRADVATVGAMRSQCARAFAGSGSVFGRERDRRPRTEVGARQARERLSGGHSVARAARRECLEQQRRESRCAERCGERESFGA